jgi:hypothetical protein
MKKIVKIALIGLIGLLAVGALALTMDYDSPELGKALLRQASSSDLEITAEGFHLNLLRGLKLEDVKVKSLMPGGSLNATADTVILEHQFWPLLRGEVLVDQIVLQKPTVEMVSTAVREEPATAAGGSAEEGAGTAADGASAGSDLELRIRRFAIVDGTLISRVEGLDEPPTTIRGLDLELRDIVSAPGAPSLIQGLSAAGDLTADEVVTATTRGKDARGDLRLEGGHMLLTDFQLPTDLGVFELSQLDVDLNTDPAHYDLQLAGDPLNTSMILGGSAGSFGSARLSLGLSGELSEDLKLVGLGKLTVTTGKLPDHAVLRAVEKLLGIAVVGQEYEAFSVDFKIERNLLIADPFHLVTGSLDLATLGAVGLFDESLSLELTALAPRELVDVKEIPREILEALTDSDGRVNLPILVAGSQLSPSVKFDRSSWGKLAKKRVQKEVEKEVGKALSRLFSKDKNDG